jgi:hypothetical protein
MVNQYDWLAVRLTRYWGWMFGDEWKRFHPSHFSTSQPFTSVVLACCMDRGIRVSTQTQKTYEKGKRYISTLQTLLRTWQSKLTLWCYDRPNPAAVLGVSPKYSFLFILTTRKRTRSKLLDLHLVRLSRSAFWMVDCRDTIELQVFSAELWQGRLLPLDQKHRWVGRNLRFIASQWEKKI